MAPTLWTEAHQGWLCIFPFPFLTNLQITCNKHTLLVIRKKIFASDKITKFVVIYAYRKIKFNSLEGSKVKSESPLLPTLLPQR